MVGKLDPGRRLIFTKKDIEQVFALVIGQFYLFSVRCRNFGTMNFKLAPSFTVWGLYVLPTP